MAFNLDITLLAVMGSLTIRFGILAATLPLLDMKSVPPLWRLGMAVCMAATLAPGIAATLPLGTVTLSWQSLIVEAVNSLVVGAMLGFTVNLVFTAVRFAGSVAGMQIGFSIVNSFDPMSNSQVSVISQLYYLLAVLIFFVSGAHQILVAAMFQSCLVVPPYASLSATGGAWQILQEFGAIFTVGFRIAAPVVVVLLLVSASMGVIVKTVPQINVLVVGFPIKIAVGLITLGLSLVFFKEILINLMGEMDDQLGRVLLAMK